MFLLIFDSKAIITFEDMAKMTTTTRRISYYNYNMSLCGRCRGCDDSSHQTLLLVAYRLREANISHDRFGSICMFFVGLQFEFDLLTYFVFLHHAPYKYFEDE